MRLSLKVPNVRLLPLLLAVLWGAVPLRSRALETEVSSGVFYFTDNAERRLAAETELSEGGLRFHAGHDPREVARDSADEEIRQGNVCLTQARSDLHAAVKTFRVRAICNEIFHDELASTLKKVASGKFHPDVFRCYAEAEAHESKGLVQVNLAFRGQLVTHQPLPPKLQKAGFPDEPRDWSLAVHEEAGKPELGWKGALRMGACGFSEAAMEKFIERFREKKHEEIALAHCRDQEVRQVDRLKRLQSQFKEYIPEEWQSAAGGDAIAGLLSPPVGVDTYAGLSECHAVSKRTGEQLERLSGISGKIASHHDVPALNPQPRSAARSPASREDED